MKTNGIPAIVMLSAGFVDCVLAIYTYMSLWNFTRQLLFVLILFYIIGCVVKVILDRNFKDMEQEEMTEDGQEEGVEEAETEEPQQESEEEDSQVDEQQEEENN